MQILGLLGMYFDAVVVEVEKDLLLFGLTLTILCLGIGDDTFILFGKKKHSSFRDEWTTNPIGVSFK